MIACRIKSKPELFNMVVIKIQIKNCVFLLVVLVVKNLPANAGDLSLISVLGRSPGEGNSYPVQYSGLENFMDYSMGLQSERLSLLPSHSQPQATTHLLSVSMDLPFGDIS